MDERPQPHQSASRSLREDDTGITTVEYIIILAFICIAAIGAWTVLGDSVDTQARGSATTLDEMSE